MRLGIGPNGSPPAVPDKMARMSSSIDLQSRNRAAPRRPAPAQQRRFAVSGPNTTTSGRMRPSQDSPAGQRLSPSPRPCPRACRRSSIPVISRCAASRPSGKFLAWAVALYQWSARRRRVAFEEVDDGLWTLLSLGPRLALTNASADSPIAPFKGGRSASSAGSAPFRKNKKTNDQNPQQLLPMSWTNLLPMSPADHSIHNGGRLMAGA